MKNLIKIVLLTSLSASFVTSMFGQTYDYYQNPQKIGSKNPKATAYFIKAFDFISHWGKEDTDSAMVYLHKAIIDDSTYAIAYATLGHILKYKGYDGATVSIDSMAILAEKALKLNPRLGDGYTLLGRVYAMKNDYRKAIDACKRAVEVEPSHRETWFWLGMRFNDLPETIDSAVWAFNKSLEVDPNFGQPHQKLGWLYLYGKLDFKQSAYHFRQMIRLYEEAKPRDERMIVGYWGLGEALIADKNFEDATDTLHLFLKKSRNANILPLNSLRSNVFAGLVRCHLGLARQELGNFIELSHETNDKNKDDAGMTVHIIEEIDALASEVKKFDFLDTLKKIREPLYANVFDKATEPYVLNGAVFSRIRSLMDDKNNKVALNELAIFVKKYDGKKEVISNLNFLMACNYSILDKKKQTLKYLKLAIGDGFNNFQWIENNPDFDNVKDDPEFKKIVQQKN